MKFSQRTSWNSEESELARRLRERVAAGLPLNDLTASNPTRCGFDYDPQLLAPLTGNTALDYDPNPRGSQAGREAVCRYYADAGAIVDSSQIILTTSTSEAYGYLFKLLCDPGDEVIVPQPSYPLFEFLADAEAVEVVPASYFYDFGWQLDLEGLRRQITPRTRAIVLVHPNNPTGHFTNLAESRELAEICKEYNLALIVDEVFLDYHLEYRLDSSTRSLIPAEDRSTFAARDLGVLIFIVSGLSKIAALPQMKVAWVLAAGQGSEAALARLELLADTYLSMNAPMQLALPPWLSSRERIQSQIRERTAHNLARLDFEIQSLSERWLTRLETGGGWYAVLRIPATQPDEVTVAELLDLGVWVHPGYFFGFPARGFLVVSLLTPTPQFSTGIELLAQYFRLNHKHYLIEGKA